MSAENGNILDLGSFDFTPDWAKKDAGVNIGKVRPERDFGVDGPRGERPARRGYGEGGKSPAGAGRPFPRKPFDGPSRGPGPGGRKPFAPRERVQPLDVEVKVLPETKALGTIIRKLQQDTHAYKLRDLAFFFLDNPSSVLLKVTPKAAPQPEVRNANPVTFFQCKACGFASTKQEDVVAHIVGAHLADYYDAKEVDCEPPKGNFSCVAKCGLSGVLLGPPNIHEFNSTVKEMIRTRYPEMSEEQYRAHIEMVRDADAIEAWRKGAVKKTVFVQKGQAGVEGAATLTREQAEGEFRRTMLPSLLDSPKHLMITADVALASPARPLVWAAKDALEGERRSPYGMCFALRGAFHHRKLNFFRVNDAHGQEFVCGLEHKAFDAEHAIPELAAAAKFIAEHPCCDKSEFPAGLVDFEKHLNWLVTTGHVVSFTNGVFSAVEKYPKYGPQWKKRSAAPAEAKAAGAEPKPVEGVEKVETVEKKEEVKDETATQLAE